MNKISSARTAGMKKIIPGFFFAACAVACLVGLFGKPVDPGLIVISVVAAVLGALLMAATVLDLADEVFDDGSHLLVRNGRVEERIALQDIESAQLSRWGNPTRLTLRLRKSGKLGNAVIFIPRGVQWPHKPGLAEELETRAARLRKYT